MSKPRTEFEQWPKTLRNAWTELTHVEQAALIRERLIWRALPPAEGAMRGISHKPPAPKRSGVAFSIAHGLLYEQEVAYRTFSHCRGAGGEAV